MTVLKLQNRIISLGEDPGMPDGLMGPKTLAAINRLLDRLAPAPVPVVAPRPRVVLPTWMPWAKMERIIWHWTAGTNRANSVDRKHYHIIIQGDGSLIRGDHSIESNAAPARKDRANHTLNCNTGSIGVSLAGMKDAKESPFNAGDYPITLEQWVTLGNVLADLCDRYTIPVTPSTVLSHAEVERTLGIKQKNKWDTARLPWNLQIRNAMEAGNQMRAMVAALL
jgi:N-acetyl-anhydromuramyl-L-alanine amidase AmpD